MRLPPFDGKKTSARSVVKMDESLEPSDVAALADAGLTAYHAAAKAARRLTPRDKCVIIGAGAGTGLSAKCTEAGGVDLRRHVCQLELDRLEVGDPVAKLSPLECVAARELEGRLRDPHGLRRDPDPAPVERRHRGCQP